MFVFLYCRCGTLGCLIESWKHRKVTPAQYWEGELQRKLKCWKNLTDSSWCSILNYWCCSLGLEVVFQVVLFWLECSVEIFTAWISTCHRRYLEKQSVCSSGYATMWCFPCFFNLILSSWLWKHNGDVLLITSRAAALLLPRSEWKQWYCLRSVLGWFEMKSINKLYLDQAIFLLSIWALCYRMIFEDKNLGLEW